MAHNGVSFLFDLDGTLVDSVYQHVQAWQEALRCVHAHHPVRRHSLRLRHL
jgi:beta-phosphoglucomutase-like phosphatase (HAD superfamily)